jgi:hypothetical protein
VPFYRSLDFFSHHVDIVDVGPRVSFYKDYLKDKKTLHVGCVDSPIFRPEKNLHIELDAHIHCIHGMDQDKEGIEKLRGYVKGKLYSSYEDIDEPYDVVLAPEVMEHNLNPGLFLKQLFELDCKEIILTVPNCIGLLKNFPGYGWKETEEGTVYAEMVHPDHKCYFSPMTLGCIVTTAMAEYAPNRFRLRMLFLTQDGNQVGAIIGRI